jgi:hypothetical protein
MTTYILTTEEEAMKLIGSAKFIEHDAGTSSYALVSVRAGAVHHVRFHNIGDREEFIFFTRNEQKLFCHNGYFGGLLVVIEFGTIHKICNFCIRADAVVLADRVPAPYMTPLGSCADLVYEYELERETALRSHFGAQYYLLFTSKPEKWEEEMQKLLNTKTCVDIVDGHLVF